MTFKDFVNSYQVEDQLAQDFIAYSRFSEAQIDMGKYSEELKKALKANIAQQLFGPNAYEYILNEGDFMISKVLELEAR